MRLNLLIAGVTCILISGANLANAADNAKQDKTEKTQLKIEVPKSSTAGTKAPLSIKNGDFELKFGGKIKIENVFLKNAYLLNNKLPDQNEFFKETVDLTSDFAFGKEKYGYNAVEAYIDLRHKGIWGKSMTFADKQDAGGGAPVAVQVSESMVGSHSHTTGLPVIYIREGWLQFSPNPIVNSKNYTQFLKFGWFPFDLGRGISLGTYYGVNKESLGLYNYHDDKYAPGIGLTGDLIKDKLKYDLYYAKLEERDKNLTDTLNSVKSHYTDRDKTKPWRGSGKDDSLWAARFKSTNDLKSWGKIDVEPYIMCDNASDQKVEFYPDASTVLGAYGLAAEYTYKTFEFGGEFAFNFGEEKLVAIDRNKKSIKNRNGSLVEVFSKIGDAPAGTTKALVTDTSKTASNVTGAVNGQAIPGYPQYISMNEDMSPSSDKTNRFRPQYTNKLGGYMAVVDAAYTWERYNLKLALAYGYASGDKDPHVDEVDKTYKGFVGIHEGYMGKRVPSIFLLDQRLLLVPGPLQAGESDWGTFYQGQVDFSFSNIQTAGIGTTWTPNCRVKKLSVNPNVVFFWRTAKCNKWVFDPNSPNATGGDYVVSNDEASKFMGTEINVLAKCELLKDLTLFANAAMFQPGTFFKDVKGVPLENDYFDNLWTSDSVVFNDQGMAERYRLSYSTAYFMNIALEYKF